MWVAWVAWLHGWHGSKFGMGGIGWRWSVKFWHGSKNWCGWRGSNFFAWVAWVHKILAWAKKIAWLMWFKILAWVAWVHKVSVDPNFGKVQKNGLFQNKME